MNMRLFGILSVLAVLVASADAANHDDGSLLRKLLGSLTNIIGSSEIRSEKNSSGKVSDCRVTKHAQGFRTELTMEVIFLL
jgi:hypothetical protein